MKNIMPAEPPEKVEEKKKSRPIGRTPGTGTSSAQIRLLRCNLTPRQDRMLVKIREQIGMSESEAVRRALDDYFDKLIARGELENDLIKPGAEPVAAPAADHKKRNSELD